MTKPREPRLRTRLRWAVGELVVCARNAAAYSPLEEHERHVAKYEKMKKLVDRLIEAVV